MEKITMEKIVGKVVDGKGIYTYNTGINLA
jgi:hypothetical protein